MPEQSSTETASPQSSDATQQCTEERTTTGTTLQGRGSTQRQETEGQATTSTGTQQQEPLTEIASKLNQVIALLTTSLNSHPPTGHTPTNTN